MHHNSNQSMSIDEKDIQVWNWEDTVLILSGEIRQNLYEIVLAYYSLISIYLIKFHKSDISWHPDLGIITIIWHGDSPNIPHEPYAHIPNPLLSKLLHPSQPCKLDIHCPLSLAPQILVRQVQMLLASLLL